MKVDAADGGLVPPPGPAPLVTDTVASPGVPAGATTVIDVPFGSWARTVAGLPSNATAGVALPNPEPLTTTVVPPTAGPDDGVRPVTVGQPAGAPASTARS